MSAPPIGPSAMSPPLAEAIRKIAEQRLPDRSREREHAGQEPRQTQGKIHPCDNQRKKGGKKAKVRIVSDMYDDEG